MNYVINIGRQFGSGGREIGQKLASQLGISFYDKELIRLASKKSGLKEDVFEEADEKKSHSIFAGLLTLGSPSVDEMYSGYYLSNETLFKIQSDVIRSLANQNSCLFVGRCADYILKDHSHSLNVFILADLDDRIRRLSNIHKLPPDKVKYLIEKTDKKRAEYYNYFSGKIWASADSYHLCINSSVLGIDETVKFIKNFAETKFRL